MKDNATNQAPIPALPKPITYTRERLLELQKAPLSQSYPKDALIIPKVTKPKIKSSL